MVCCRRPSKVGRCFLNSRTSALEKQKEHTLVEPLLSREGEDLALYRVDDDRDDLYDVDVDLSGLEMVTRKRTNILRLL